MKCCKKFALAVLLAVIFGVAANADPVSGTLFFTTFNGGQNVNKVSFAYDGASSFTIGAVQNIASTGGADGLIFAPNGQLLVGGQGNAVHMVDPTTGTFVTVTAGGVPAFHEALDPSGLFSYAAGIPSGTVATIPLSPFANGTSHTVSGDDSSITGIAFLGTQAYYTNAGPGGCGNFGTLDTTTFATTRLVTGGGVNPCSFHGITSDPFTGDLITDSGINLDQLDGTGAVVSHFTSPFGGDFDQGAADGKGHLLVANNDGELFFMDYSASGKIGDPSNFFTQVFLASNLDDVAPLSGLGSQTVPEPSSILLLGSALLGLAGFARRRSRSL